MCVYVCVWCKGKDVILSAVNNAKLITGICIWWVGQDNACLMYLLLGANTAASNQMVFIWSSSCHEYDANLSVILNLVDAEIILGKEFCI